MNKLKDISLSISSGLTPLRSNKDYWNKKDIPWLKTEQLGEFIIYDTSEYISNEALKNTSLKLYPKNTISIAMYGEGKTRGNVSILGTEMATNQACCNIIVDEYKADYLYVYYWIKNNYLNLRNLAAGVRKNLNSDDIKNFEINTLPLGKQREISAVLSNLDKKIISNNKVNTTLEELSKVIYDYWFVQFEFPNEEGKPYKSSGGEMVYNEELKREIPKSWQAKQLKDLVSLNERGITPLYNEKHDICVISQKSIRDNNIDKSEAYWHDCSKAYKKDLELQFMDTLINSMGTGTLGRISPYVLKDAAVPHSCVTLLRYKKNISLPCWLYRTLKHYEKVIESKGVGSTGQTSLDNSELGDIWFIYPKYSIIERYEKNVLGFYEIIMNNNMSNLKLNELRDFLLPLLMNGQVTIKEVEDKVKKSTQKKPFVISNHNDKFELWLQNQGLAARGDIDRQTLREIFDAMDDDDK